MKKRLKIFIPIVILLSLIILVSWKIILPRITPSSYKIDTFDIKELNDAERPFVWDKIAPLQPDFPVDEDGIILYGDKSYSPNQIANIGLYYLDSYRQTHNAEYLQSARKYADKLKEISFSYKNALYFPYNFNFAMHERKDDILKAPWYSGMAQGEALSFFVRLYQVTHQKEYLEVADKIFASFTYLGKNNSPWTAWVDEGGFYWIEEYPEEEPDHTLNGFIFGLYGVYDYYQLTKNNQAKEVLQGSLTALKHYLPDFRNMGNISFYCLKHKVQNEKYHQTHIKQLNMLYKMTSDEFFLATADNFYNDYH